MHLPLTPQRRSGPSGAKLEATLTSMSVILPLELQFLVLDQSSVDVLYFRDLCTVCRAWGAHAQKIIFRHVWVTLVTIRRLWLLLRYKPHLGTYIETVTVAGSLRSPFGHTSMQQLFRYLSDIMPNVRTLDILITKFGPELVPLQHSALRKITHLRLRSAAFAFRDTLLQFIALFPHLEGLEVSGDYVLHTTPPKFSPPPPKHLRYLACNAFCYDSVMKWLASGPTMVDNLYITAWGYNDSLLEEFLFKIGNRLQRLRLTDLGTQWAPLNEFTIPPCPSLKSLEIDLHRSTSSRNLLESGFLSILKQLSSSVLSTMYFDTHVTADHLQLPWDKVDVVLADFTGLQEVIFDLHGFVKVTETNENAFVPTYVEVCDGMRKAMVISEARGILKFWCAGRGTSTASHLCRYVFC
ncbi:hypothetical protein B0H16DRAFT_1538474 [Mycena metata]|uniref:Uncharacterized protein n=1 Tax=Mycena metata TaxID=1033252 RepID=A0AAD7NEM6_9AGAR|nr:hypothetical protein B0H16DRAFT_1538474 [Mycena metata]